MRVASLDCGTNTMLLLIADIDGDEIEILEDQERIVRLGEGLDATGLLSPAAIVRGRAALAEYIELIRKHECAHVLGVGTEAIRRAENGHLFVNEATSMLGRIGGRFSVISGKREAEICWRATSHAFPALSDTHTVMDIGGGSTEIIVGDKRIESAVSLPIGSVRLTERLIKSDPPTPQERDELRETIDAALASLTPLEPELVGIAGTVTNLAKMVGKSHGDWLSYDEVQTLLEKLAHSTVDERRKLSGLDALRADVIFAGAMILERVMNRAHSTRCLISNRGVRWGLLYEVLSPPSSRN